MTFAEIRKRHVRDNIPARRYWQIGKITLIFNLHWAWWGFGFGLYPGERIRIFECGPIDIEWQTA